MRTVTHSVVAAALLATFTAPRPRSARATLIGDLSFGGTESLVLRPGTYDVRVVAAGTDTVVADLSGTTRPAGTAVSAWAVGFLPPKGRRRASRSSSRSTGARRR